MAITDNAAPVDAPVHSLQKVLDPFKDGFVSLESFLNEQISSFEPEVRPLVRDCFLHSGKKLRPTLVFAFFTDRKTVLEGDVIKAAAIVELVHLATLVHDDILDEADLRHRSKTMVSRYGAHTSVLLGDALFAHALHLAADFPTVDICRAVSRATRQVCSGEIAQTFNRGTLPRLDSYFRMIDLKTAELFKVSAFLGAFLAGLSSAEIEAARRFARHLGIAYQIYDDTADIFAEEKSAGKTLGTDAASGKATLPVILWLHSLADRERREVLESWRNGEDQLSLLRRRIGQDGIAVKLDKAFQEEISMAREAGEVLASPHRRQRMEALLAYLEQSWNKIVPRRLQEV
mgnify:CR=1 FL=1